MSKNQNLVSIADLNSIAKQLQEKSKTASDKQSRAMKVVMNAILEATK